MANRKSSTMSHNEVKKFLKNASMDERIDFILDNPCFLDIMYQENMIDYDFAKRLQNALVDSGSHYSIDI